MTDTNIIPLHSKKGAFAVVTFPEECGFAVVQSPARLTPRQKARLAQALLESAMIEEAQAGNHEPDPKGAA